MPSSNILDGMAKNSRNESKSSKSFRNGILLVVILMAGGSLLLTSQSVSIMRVENFLLDTNNDSASRDASSSHSFRYDSYVPASTERYIVENAVQLGYDDPKENAKTCTVWKDENASPIYNDLHAFSKELEEYNHRLNNFTTVPDLRLRIDDPAQDVCQTVELHQDGLAALFPSGQLSFTSSGYVEPLLPPFRHPDFCFKKDEKTLMDLSYLVHDFGAMCRKLKRHSRIILIDMGASLRFHGGRSQPAIYLIDLFRKFGFPFDHIYAFEVTKTEPKVVFEKLPANLFAAYHWINVGVSSDPESSLNPLKMILDNYNEEDIIIVKLDIDTSKIEVPLAHQLLADDRYAKLVDQFYFEHHVRIKELVSNWKLSMQGSFKESLDLFSGLREKGIPAHSWV